MRTDPKFGVVTLGSVGNAYLADVPKLADCRPGLKPTEYNVVVVMVEVPDAINGIYLPEGERERIGDAMQLGRIIAASPLAFNYDAIPESERPKKGDLIWFARFAGGLFTGRDGRSYRMIKDKDVMGVIPEEEEPVMEEEAKDIA